MPVQLLRRDEWAGEPRELGQMFVLHKHRSGRQLEAVCRLLSHPLGWELRLEIAGSLQRSQVCRSQDEVLDTGEAWRAAMG